MIGDLRAKNESFLETTSFVSASSAENNSNKKASKKEKEAAKKEKERKRSKVKTTKSLGGGGGGVEDSPEAQQPERKTRSLGEMLNPLTANFISYSHPNTPLPQKRSSQDDGSLNGDAATDGSRSNGRTTPRLGSYRQQRSVSRIRRVPISARSSGIDKPDLVDLYGVVGQDNHQCPSSDAISPSTVAVSAVETSKEASLEDEAISIRSNNSEYSCSDDNAALDLSDDATQHHHHHHHQTRRHGDAVYLNSTLTASP